MSIALSSCGYQGVYSLGKDDLIPVSIPLIYADDNGILRENLAHAISNTGRYFYKSSNARYQLVVKILNDKTEKVSYIWDQDPISGEILNRLYPSEGRRLIKALVSFKDTELDKCVVEPFEVSTFVDFDFVNPTVLKNIQFQDVFGETQSVLQYSLGQLDSEEGAKSESYYPIYKELTEKIIQGIHLEKF